MPIRSARIRRLVERFPFSGHPALETLLERLLTRSAHGGGLLLGRGLRGLAPGLDARRVYEAFESGLQEGRGGDRGGGRVVPFPGS